MNTAPSAKGIAAAQPQKRHDQTLPIAGGALAFLAIGGAAVAMTRRRHDEEDEGVDELTIEQEPTAAEGPQDEVIHHEEPAMIAPAPSAFARHDEQTLAASPMAQPTGLGDDRLPGESWVQRAYRGPTPSNPSVSLRARLKRAAFFDKRERDVAAGNAEPVDMDAGLPEAMVEEQQDQELA